MIREQQANPAELPDSLLALVLDTSAEGMALIDADGRCRYANAAATELLRRDLSPDGQAAIEAIMSVPPGARVSIPGFANGVEASGIRLDMDGASFVALSLRSVGEERRREREAWAVAKIAASLTFDQSMEATLDNLAAVVVEVSPAIACAVALIDEDKGIYQLAGTHGLPEGYAAGVEEAWRAGANLSSLESYRTRSPIVRSLHGYILVDPRQAAIHDLIRDAAWEAIASVPLISRGRTLGSMSCSYPAGIEPDAGELAFLQVIADQAAVAVETAYLIAEVQGKAVLEERQRLARELHDSVSQALYGIGLGARTARAQLDRDPAKAVDPVDYVIALAETGMAEMRALLFELRPESLEQEGLVAAIRKHAAALQGRYGLRLDLDLGEEPALPLPAKEALYRIAQEATHNTVKHARATRIAISLATQSDGRCCLEVADDGVGFEPGGEFPGHIGLKSMRERIERLGGSLAITSAPGDGTRVQVDVRGS